MTPRDQRALIIGASIIALWLGAVRGVPTALRAVDTMEERIELKAHLLESSRSELRSLPALRDSVEWLERATARIPGSLLVAGTPDEAKAEIIRRLMLALEEIPASVEIQPDVPDSARRGPLGHARVTVILETDVAGFSDAVSAIGLDSATSLLSITVDAVDPEAPAEVAETLRIRLGVEGWFMAEDLPDPEDLS